MQKLLLLHGSHHERPWPRRGAWVGPDWATSRTRATLRKARPSAEKLGVARRLRLQSHRRHCMVVSALALVAVGSVAAALGAHHPPLLVILPAGLAQQYLLYTLLTYRGQDDREVLFWKALRRGALAFVLAGLFLGALALGGVDTMSGAAVLTWASAATFLPTYSALARWHRYAVTTIDPYDTLNGLSALLAILAVLELANSDLHIVSSLGHWLGQGVLVQAAVATILLGTVTVEAVESGAARDMRVWLSASGFLAVLVIDCAVTAGAVSSAPLALTWGLPALAFGLGTLVPQLDHPSRPAKTVSSTVGAFLILITTLVVLSCGAVSDIGRTAEVLAVLAGTGSGLRLLLNIHDLSQLEVSRHEAMTDELTGLPNRRAVIRELQVLSGGSCSYCFALLDINRFKEVNDSLGHGSGDELLQLTAARLEERFPSPYVVGRLGGDEFAIIARCPDDIGALDQLGHAVVDMFLPPFHVANVDLHVSASVGVTSGPLVVVRPSSGEPGPMAVLQRADIAMYEAKRSGRGHVIFDRACDETSHGRLTLAEQLRSALATDQLVVHYQPQVDVTTEEVIGVEALVRWQHPERGLLLPGQFLPLAEEHDLMGELTNAVLERAVTQVAKWRAEGRSLRVSVNLSVTNLLDLTLPQRVSELLRKHDLPASALELEVTENVLMVNPERSHAVVREFANQGITLSIDDFGTGFASLTYLRELPVCELKLDRSFTVDLLRDSRTAAIIQSTVHLAHVLGLRVVAEGVQDDATFQALRDLHCNETQGYFHAPPLPPQELEHWLDGQAGSRPRSPGPCLRLDIEHDLSAQPRQQPVGLAERAYELTSQIGPAK